MVSKAVEIVNHMGFHMRPANTFVNAMSKYESDINIVHRGNRINGKSIMNLMAACLKFGTTITIECSGIDENEMLKEAVELIESGFGED